MPSKQDLSRRMNCVCREIPSLTCNARHQAPLYLNLRGISQPKQPPQRIHQPLRRPFFGIIPEGFQGRVQ